MSIIEQLGFTTSETREKVTHELLEKLSNLSSEEIKISELSIVFTGSVTELDEIIDDTPIHPMLIMQRQANDDDSPFLEPNILYEMCTINPGGACIGSEHIPISGENLISAPFFFSVKSRAAWNLLVGTADDMTVNFKKKLKTKGMLIIKGEKEDFDIGDLLIFRDPEFTTCRFITENRPCILMEKFPEGNEVIQQLNNFVRKSDLLVGFYDENDFFDTTTVESWRMKKAE